MQLDNKTELALQEKVITLVEALQGTSRILLLLLAGAILLAVPLGFFSRYVFFSLLYSEPNYNIYIKPNPQDLQVVDSRVSPAHEGAYYAFVRIVNPNADVAIRKLDYLLTVTGQNGTTLATHKASTYLMPSQDRILMMPAVEISEKPTQVQVKFGEYHWSKVGPYPNLDFTFEGKQWSIDDLGRFLVSAQVRNDNPFVIAEADVSVILYNSRHEIVSINSTVLNYLQPDEIRYLRSVWGFPIRDRVVDVDFKISVNQLDKNILITQPVNIDTYDPRSVAP
jgi:hypothetical protein